MTDIDKDEVSKITAAEFRDHGYLQELNRNFLHPLGLALEVVTDNEGHITGFGQVWDLRDDPEGMIYADGVIDHDKAERIREEMSIKCKERFKRFRWAIQPSR